MEFVNGLEHPKEIGELFREYTDMLVENDPTFASYLVLQDYDGELRHLAGKYGPPRSRLILALENGEAAGSIALKEMDAERCELKRLYVRPRFRGKNLGEFLTVRILEDARQEGYSFVRLDTLPTLKTALSLYRRLGFYEIPAYYDCLISGTIFMEYQLK